MRNGCPLLPSLLACLALAACHCAKDRGAAEARSALSEELLDERAPGAATSPPPTAAAPEEEKRAEAAPPVEPSWRPTPWRRVGEARGPYADLACSPTVWWTRFDSLAEMAPDYCSRCRLTSLNQIPGQYPPAYVDEEESFEACTARLTQADHTLKAYIKWPGCTQADTTRRLLLAWHGHPVPEDDFAQVLRFAHPWIGTREERELPERISKFLAKVDDAIAACEPEPTKGPEMVRIVEEEMPKYWLSNYPLQYLVCETEYSLCSRRQPGAPITRSPTSEHRYIFPFIAYLPDRPDIRDGIRWSAGEECGGKMRQEVGGLGYSWETSFDCMMRPIRWHWAAYE